MKKTETKTTIQNAKFLPLIIPGWIPSIKCEALSDLPPAKNALEVVNYLRWQLYWNWNFSATLCECLFGNITYRCMTNGSHFCQRIIRKKLSVNYVYNTDKLPIFVFFCGGPFFSVVVSLIVLDSSSA